MIDILILTGKSCSGKDSIARELIKNHGYQRLVTYTDRPMREGEVDGVDYHFLSTHEFLEKINSDFFLEYRFYNTEFGIWHYGSSVDSFKVANSKTLAILTPEAFSKLKKHNIPYTSVYIKVTDKTIKQRQIERNDDEFEATRRFNADKHDFKDVEKLVDYIINNNNIDTVSKVAKDIDKLHRYNITKRGDANEV